jgi:cobyrinic acid a,c-diamide synthase
VIEAPVRSLPPPGQRVALASDAALSFIYPHVLAGWRAAGAEIVTFSPLADEPPPEDCDACWLPGGYPELHAQALAGAGRFLSGLRRFAQTRPIHGECGGYMALGEAIEDAEGRRHPMAGLLPVSTSFARRRLHLGYRVARLTHEGALGPEGSVLVGHEFHYASVTGGAAPNFAAIADAEGAPLGLAGHRIGNVSGTFFHAIAPRPG